MMTAEAVATAIVGGVAVEFRSDGSATMTAGMTLECSRCGALHDVEGKRIRLLPGEAMLLLEALRRFVPPEKYFLAAEALRNAEGRR